MSDAVVVFVHGLWMPGVELTLLRRRVERERNYRTQLFHYRSLRRPMAEHLSSLRDTVDALDAQRVHLVGHSLGGLVILRYLEQFPMRQPGRVVLIGSPVGGSQSALHVGQWSWGRRILGPTACAELLQFQRRDWSSARELGVIAGTASVGLARMLVRFTEENDGVVAVSETQVAGAKGSLVVGSSHSGMLLSARVARETGSFLEYGSFGR
jgi:pimeloyl-ACP methyl ester carboxylesterase